MTPSPTRDEFSRAYAAGEAQIVWLRVIDDLETPVSAYLKIARDRPYAFLFESVEGGAWRGRYSILTLQPDLLWRCNGDVAEISQGDDLAFGNWREDALPALDSLKALEAASRLTVPQGLPAMCAGLFGVWGYDLVRLAEPLGEANPDPLNLPDALLTRPSLVAVFDSVMQEIILAATVRPDGRDAATAYDDAAALLASTARQLLARPPARYEAAEVAQAPFDIPMTRAAYGEIVERAKTYIRAGDVFQVVPSHRMSADFPLSPFAFYRSLRRLNPSPFMYYLNFGDFQLAGSSPEILVRLRDEKVTIRPIAGTRRRGATPEEDLALEEELLADPKERAEHMMLLDLGRNDVGQVSRPPSPGPDGAMQPSVRVTESFTVERYSHVMHIVSNVEGDADPALDPVDVLMAALPAGTLSGAPKVRAMQIIDELETVKRGCAYAGAVGYISSGGDVDTCILLRTAVFKDGKIHVQAGGGVTSDSDPDAEYDETLQKARAVMRAAEEAWRYA